MNDLKGASLICGIDPGSSSGSIAILNVNDFSVQFHSLPTTSYRSIRRNKDGKRKYINCKKLDELGLLQLLNDILRPIFPPYPALVVLEHQANFPGQGAVTGGKLLYSYGLTKGLLMPMPVQVISPKPLEWKKTLGCLLGGDATTYAKKTRDWERAIDLHPELLETLSPKYKNFDKCDALLLCHYGLRYLRRKGMFKDLDIDDNEPALI